MTPEEHEHLKLKMRILALEVVNKWLVDRSRAHLALAPASVRQAMIEKVEASFQKSSDEYATMTLDHYHPAESDLRSALFQEAFEEARQRLLQDLRRPLDDASLRALRDAAGLLRSPDA